jgi:hypothetical protein
MTVVAGEPDVEAEVEADEGAAGTAAAICC